MHIILGALGTIVTILWLLHRLAEMGIDLGGLNPWLWRRRRRWKKQYEANPIYGIESPMEATALLVTATAKADGDMSGEEKQLILQLFEKEFGLSKRDAAGLMIASTYLLGRGDEVRESLARVLAPSIDEFNGAQAESAVELMQRVAAVGDGPTTLQSQLIGETRSLFEQRAESLQKNWT